MTTKTSSSARPRSFLAPLLTQPQQYHLRNTRTGTVLASTLELAADSASRRRGLLGRAGLEAGHALFIVPCGAVHTFFMRFAIDVAFVRKDGTVLKCAHAVGPWRIAGTLTGYAAIEMAAGSLRRAGVERGDRLVLEISGDPFHG